MIAEGIFVSNCSDAVESLKSGVQRKCLFLDLFSLSHQVEHSVRLNGKTFK